MRSGLLLATTLLCIEAFHFHARRPTPLATSNEDVTAIRATWSNGQAIKEYQDFLETGKSELEKEDDGPSVIVSSADNSPLVDAIVALGKGEDIVRSPRDPLPDTMGGRDKYPIYIALPPYELRDFLQNLEGDWKNRTEDFVFISGGRSCGVVEPILREFGMCRDSMTQLLVGFSLPRPLTGSVNARKPEDLSVRLGEDANGEAKWAGESQACGKWNGAVAHRLKENAIRCKQCFYREWRRAMWEQAMYDCVWNVVGSVREEKTDHLDVALYYELESSDMMWELANGLRGGLAVTLIYGFEDRLFSFAEQRGKDMPCEIDERMFDHSINIFPGQCKMLWEYCNYAKSELGLLKDCRIPKVEVSSIPSLVKKGNLRADGVI